MAGTDLTAQRLRELLHYCPSTGSFTWLVRRGKALAGSIAGSVDDQGYLKIGIDGNDYRAQRLAWLYVHGKWPTNQVDHRDGRRANNAIGNLRDVSQFVNQQNQRGAHFDNRNGLMGVSRRRQGWVARISINGTLHHLGTFQAPDEAHAAYLAAKRAKQIGCTI